MQRNAWFVPRTLLVVTDEDRILSPLSMMDDGSAQKGLDETRTRIRYPCCTDDEYQEVDSGYH